jgi:glycerate-2-kinase
MAFREALAWVAELRPEDVLVVLLSGGASSLLSCPAAGLSLAELAETTRLLLAGGADIEQTNAVRKHLSALAGGQLARLASARRIHVLVVSDVPGDRLDVIGSGPFAPDPTSYGDALAALSARGIAERVPPRVREHLAAGARGERAETPKPGDAAFARVRHRILATNRTALDAVCAAARRSGLRTRVLPALRGEARQAGAAARSWRSPRPSPSRDAPPRRCSPAEPTGATAPPRPPAPSPTRGRWSARAGAAWTPARPSTTTTPTVSSRRSASCSSPGRPART